MSLFYLPGFMLCTFLDKVMQFPQLPYEVVLTLSHFTEKECEMWR
jgi:hypothetical protein